MIFFISRKLNYVWDLFIFSIRFLLFKNHKLSKGLQIMMWFHQYCLCFYLKWLYLYHWQKGKQQFLQELILGNHSGNKNKEEDLGSILEEHQSFTVCVEKKFYFSFISVINITKSMLNSWIGLHCCLLHGCLSLDQRISTSFYAKKKYFLLK